MSQKRKAAKEASNPETAFKRQKNQPAWILESSGQGSLTIGIRPWFIWDPPWGPANSRRV